MNLKTNEKNDTTLQNEFQEKIDFLSVGDQPESIDSYAPQIILSPLTPTLHYQEINHSTFTPDLAPFYDLLDKSSSFRYRWKRIRNFFHLYQEDSSYLFVDFYNSAKEWLEALDPFTAKNILLQVGGNHWNLFRFLLLPAFDEFFQTLAVMYEIPYQISQNIHANKDNEKDFVAFINKNEQKSESKSKVTQKIIEAYKNIYFLTKFYNNEESTNNNENNKDDTNANSKKNKDNKDVNAKDNDKEDDDKEKKNSEYNINDTLHEVLIEKRIALILNKYFPSTILKEDIFISIPLYRDLFIPTDLKMDHYKYPESFELFSKTIIKNLPLFQQIFSHLASAIPIIKLLKEPITFSNDTEKTPIIDVLRIKQSKMTFRYFLYALLLIKNFHSVIHIVQSYYSLKNTLMHPEIIRHLNSLFYQQFKLARFIMKYEEHFQLLVRRNITIFLYYLKKFQYIGENPEKKIKIQKPENEEKKDDNENEKEKEKDYYRYRDDFHTLNPELDIDNEKDKQNDQKTDKSKNKTANNNNNQAEKNNSQTTTTNNNQSSKNKKNSKDDNNNQVQPVLRTAPASVEDNKLYLLKLKSLIPSSFSANALSTSSSMFSSILIALSYKTKFLNHIDDYLYQWPMAIDFRNTLAEFSDYSFLFTSVNYDSKTASLVKQMILYATLVEPPKTEKKDDKKKDIKDEEIKYAFDDPSNTNLLCLFSIYDSALVAEPKRKKEIQKEARQLLYIALKEISKCLIGCNDIIVDVKTTKEKEKPKTEQEDDEDEEFYKNDDGNIYTKTSNNINNRFIDYLNIKSFEMLGKLYQISSIISQELNILFYEKLNEILQNSIDETKIENAIKNLKLDRLRLIVLNTRHEFLVSKGAILDSFEMMINKIMLIMKPGQIESRFSLAWSKRLIDIIDSFMFDIDDSNFVNYNINANKNDQVSNNSINETDSKSKKDENLNKPIKFGPRNFFHLLKLTPYGGATHYIKCILRSINDKNKMNELIEEMNDFQDSLETLFPCPIQPYGPEIDTQFHSYKIAIELMEIDSQKLNQVYNKMAWFGNHFCMMLILDLASEVDQSTHTTFQWYIKRSIDASAGRQACSYIFDESWLSASQKIGELTNEIEIEEEEEFRKRRSPHSYELDSKSKYYSMMIDEYNDNLPQKDSQYYSKMDRKAEVDLNSSLIKGIFHFNRIIRNRDDLNIEKTKNMINIMLFYIVLEKKKKAISGGFLMCAVALLKALNAWEAFKVDSVIQRLCYQLKNYKSQIQKGNKKQKQKQQQQQQQLKQKQQQQQEKEKENNDSPDLLNCSNFLFKLFYQLELCDYYV